MCSRSLSLTPMWASPRVAGFPEASGAKNSDPFSVRKIVVVLGETDAIPAHCSVRARAHDRTRFRARERSDDGGRSPSHGTSKRDRGTLVRNEAHFPNGVADAYIATSSAPSCIVNPAARAEMPSPDLNRWTRGALSDVPGYGAGRRAAVAVCVDFAELAFADFFLLLRAAFFFFTVFFFATFLSTLLAAGFGESAAAAAVPARIATSESARTKVRNMLPLGTAFIRTAQLRGAHPIDHVAKQLHHSRGERVEHARRSRTRSSRRMTSHASRVCAATQMTT